jgi:prevent-host-death family protein
MYTTLRESKATLSALVERACAGEEVVITVRGRPRVRLCPVEDDRRFSSTDFVRELESIKDKYRVSAESPASEELVADLREDRA